MLLPDWFPINIYEMSSWTRGIVIPLALVYAHKPDWHLPEGITVTELFKKPGGKPKSLRLGQARRFLAECISGTRPRPETLRKLPWKPFAQARSSLARTWMLERLERSEGLGTIYPAMMNSIFALLAEGATRRNRWSRAKFNFSSAMKLKKTIRSACSRAFLRCGIRRSRWSH